MLVNEEWFEFGFNTSISHLARDPSDHAMTLSTRLDNKPKPFRFVNCWTTRDDFLTIVQESWQHQCESSPLQALCQKLKRLKRHGHT